MLTLIWLTLSLIEKEPISNVFQCEGRWISSWIPSLMLDCLSVFIIFYYW